MRGATAILLALALALPIAGAVQAPSLLPERPSDGTCEPSGKILCAGADAGSNFRCATSRAGLATCDWTWGYLSGGWSPIGAPGKVETTYSGTLRTCTDSDCVAAPVTTASTMCTWAGLFLCDGVSVAGAPGHYEQQLALGQCLKMWLDLSLVATAVVPPVGDPMWTVTYANHDLGAGETCFVDDGR